MNRIMIVKKSIIEFNTECIVNAANKYLTFGGGVCGVIFRAAGPAILQSACNKIGHCDTGDAVITKAYDLKKNKYIIHAVGPKYDISRIMECQEELYNAYKRSLELMIENKCHSIAFPLISSGIYGYPVMQAWKVALESCMDFIHKHKDENINIYFAVIDDDIYNIGNEVFNNIMKDNVEYANYIKSKPLNTIKLTKDVFESLDDKDIIAVMFSKFNLLGNPGNTELIDVNYNRYLKNSYDIKNDINQKEILYKLFDEENLHKMECEDMCWIESNDYSWIYFDLGFGYNLLLRYDLYREIGNMIFDVDKIRRYRNWKEFVGLE